MNEIELIRAFRAKAAEVDRDEAQRARSALMRVIERERGDGSAARRKVPRRTLAIALAMVALPGGYAAAEALNGSDPSASCPEADAAFERAGVDAPDVWAECPASQDEITRRISQARADQERMREVVPGH